MRNILLVFILFVSYLSFGQQTKVTGSVLDPETKEGLPGVTVKFQLSKIGTTTDSLGFYILESYYATDSLVFFFPEYKVKTVKVKRDVAQTIDITLEQAISDIETVFVLPPDEFPSTTLHKKIVANKPINNKEKLAVYDYEGYTKIQLDVNNIGDKLAERKVIQPLSLVLNYMDSTEDGKTYLPLLLSENISKFYYKNNPKRTREVVSATQISGVENVQLNQFLGEMYLDFNVYDNYLNLFGKAFVSPIANFARTYYRFYLVDSTFIDNQWCYKMTFKPKRTGDMTFYGEMWIHDTTYAVKNISMNISDDANINYVQDLYFEHHFDQVEKEVWMLTEERMIVDLKATKGTDLYGVYGRKYTSRKDFVINVEHPEDFYKSPSTVEFEDGAKNRDSSYWAEHRHTKLNKQENRINEMVDSLNKQPFFKFAKNATYMLSTGYYPFGKIEIGNVHSLIATNPVEKFRTGFGIRTSNNFSRTIELGGTLYYGFLDEKFKYSLKTRLNLSKKKRAQLILYGSSDIEQLGNSPTATSVGSVLGNLLRTGPLDKLTFVEKIGTSFEKDFGRNLTTTLFAEYKKYTPLGIADYNRVDESFNLVPISQIISSEISFKVRYSKNTEYVAGSFDRSLMPTTKPIFTLVGVFGIKGVFGSEYDYQKLELNYEQTRNLGVFGRCRYGVTGGIINGKTAYPLLKVHEASQSYWLYENSFNRMNFFEFISDQYVTAFVQQHWQGLFFDRIPLIKKLQWRLVTCGRLTYGTISDRHQRVMLLPDFTKSFGKTPYAEVSVGIENIFKVIRVDAVWRLTHLDPGMAPVSIRARWSLNF
jgi:hypothetical protein